MNPLHLFIDHASGYVEEKDLNPLYLNIDYASGYIKKKTQMNIWFLTLQIKIKSN